MESIAPSALAIDTQTTRLAAALADIDHTDLSGVACADVILAHLQEWQRRLNKRLDFFDGAYPCATSSRAELEAYARFVILLMTHARVDDQALRFLDLHACEKWVTFGCPHWQAIIGACGAIEAEAEACGRGASAMATVIADALEAECLRQAALQNQWPIGVRRTHW